MKQPVPQLLDASNVGRNNSSRFVPFRPVPSHVPKGTLYNIGGVFVYENRKCITIDAPFGFTEVWVVERALIQKKANSFPLISLMISAPVAQIITLLWLISFLKFLWSYISMYLNCRVFSGFNGRLPFNLDLNKAMEALYGTSSTRRWRGKVLILGLVGFVTIIWGFMSFNDGSLGMREKAPDMGGEKAWILQQHFNISKSQVLAFASLFSESDQSDDKMTL
ncbi:hypothetical protein DVH24_028058 [Malus domestica]|uniref:Uncharacterized protein n=1 Tax=Malus domestica TaxID=3750 RepID=A0A498HFJ7_MALDO|nr:hypothetical protein DVH24_028058 [Malus domestica]